jgi:AcrR family transcriptional regulator
LQGRPLTPTETEAARAQLTQAAMGIVEREGREACSLRRVAAEAGMSRSTPYTYFSDKEALLDSVRAAALQRLADGCEDALASGADTAQRLRGVGRAYVAFALQHGALYDLVFETNEPSAEHQAAMARYRELAESPLREARAQGVTTLDPVRLGHVLWAGTHGLIGLHRAGKLRHGISFEELLQDLGDVLAFGFVRRDGGGS